jgi:4-amino-4-deoxy-L-arabinose transferase-like glycosyltransferase
MTDIASSPAAVRGLIDRLLSPFTPGWRGPALAALVVLVSALPGLIALPPLDRDESRFAQATAQMLETGDYVNIKYQDAPRDKKPVGIHWLQAAAVSLTSSAEARAIQPYRLPSLLGAMIAAAACAWGASAFMGSRRGALAGALLGASILLSSEAFIAKTDALLCGAVTLSMAALARLYLAARRGEPLRTSLKFLFWLGQAVALIDKGPIGPMVAALTLLSLWAMDRDLKWAAKLGWIWGLGLVLLIVGPWAAAITVSTDGKFWGAAVGGDLAPKLKGGHEGHAAPFGLHMLLTPILFFPATALLPAALVTLWQRRAEPLVRFAACWLIPSWLVFEITPTKLVHYTLPTYGALAWLMAAALEKARSGAPGLGPIVRWTGAGLSTLVGLAFAVVAISGEQKYGSAPGMAGAGLTAIVALAAGLTGAFAVLSLGGNKRPSTGAQWAALSGAVVLGAATHMLLSGLVAPGLAPLWTSHRLAQMVAADHLDPRDGVTQGPVVVAGFAEPSLVFQLGTQTFLGDAEDAVQGLSEGQPALVESRQNAQFRQVLAERKVAADPVDQLSGLNYSSGKAVSLTLWRARDPAPPKPAAPTAPINPDAKENPDLKAPTPQTSGSKAP